MIYDIFKKKKQETKELSTPKIVADIHEKNSLVIANLIELNTSLEIANLQIGDYQIGDIVIERKTFSDFISSMLNKRLVEQLKNMKQYNKKILIIEGRENKDMKINIHPNAIRGMILTTSLEFQTQVIFTENEKETATYLYLLAKRELKHSPELSLHARIPKTKEEQKKYILESFPEVGPKTAEKLLKDFKSIKRIINAKEEELKGSIGSKAQILKDLVEE